MWYPVGDVRQIVFYMNRELKKAMNFRYKFECVLGWGS